MVVCRVKKDGRCPKHSIGFKAQAGGARHFLPFVRYQLALGRLSNFFRICGAAVPVHLWRIFGPALSTNLRNSISHPRTCPKNRTPSVVSVSSGGLAFCPSARLPLGIADQIALSTDPLWNQFETGCSRCQARSVHQVVGSTSHT